MNHRVFTLSFTLFAVVLCLLHYFGLDRESFFLFALSPAVWVIEIFQDIHGVNLFLTYLLTIGFWFLLGWIFDRGVARRRTKAAS